jgi:hypothetical protein
VSIFVHALYKHAYFNVNGRDSTNESCDAIKEYHFHINNDHEHDTLFVQHYFGLIYESFRKNDISFTKYLIW